jgi:DNA invertase Pin-like site-specific DNA recombinase
MEACEAWVAKMEFTLSDDKFLDEGRSGYTGEHLGEKGQLKRFLDLVEAKKIPKGSYLVIESLDRLSREGVNAACARFLDILNAGIYICTLMDGEKVYSPNGSAADLIMSVLVMARANEESATKSKRASDDWINKRARARTEKKPYGKRVARWLQLLDGKYVVIPERVEIVQRVFKETIKGHGYVAIARDLNADKIPAFRGGTWCATSVGEMLKNRSVLGEWLPKDGGPVIENYFPRIIDSETFQLAEEAMSKRSIQRVTKQSASFQVWQQCGFCSICASPMYLLSKNKKFVGGKLYTYKYLLCSNKRKGLCMDAATIRLADSEAAFKEILVNVGALGLIQTEAAAITDAMALVDAALHKQQTIRAQHMAKLTEHPEMDFIYELVARAGQEIKRLEAERAELDAKHTAQTIAQSDKAWLLEQLPLIERDDRQRANALLVRLGVVARITGGPEPVFTVYQNERLIFATRVVDGKPETTSYSPDVTMRMYDQSELAEHELYVNVGFRSKQLPRPGEPVKQATPKARSTDAPDWSQYDEPLAEQDYEDEYTIPGE